MPTFVTSSLNFSDLEPKFDRAMRRDGNSANIVHLIFYLTVGQGRKITA